jgi:hypothetical protein
VGLFEPFYCHCEGNIIFRTLETGDFMSSLELETGDFMSSLELDAGDFMSSLELDADFMSSLELNLLSFMMLNDFYLFIVSF